MFYRQRLPFHLLCKIELPPRMAGILVYIQTLALAYLYREVRTKKMRLKPVQASKVFNSRMKEIQNYRTLCQNCFSCFYNFSFWHLFAYFIYLFYYSHFSIFKQKICHYSPLGHTLSPPPLLGEYCCY